MAGAISEAVGGFALIGRGAGLLLQRPRLFVLGALPPLVSSLLLLVALVALATQLDRILPRLTPFADRWDPALTGGFRLLVGVALVGGAALLLVLVFTALTLTLGAPLYDLISESVDASLGGLPTAEPQRWTSGVVRGVRQSATLLGVTVLVAPVLFGLGLVPVLGQTVVPVASAVFGGWMLCTELVGSAFERRGLTTLADRRLAMRARPARVLGFAVPVFVGMAVPFAAVVVFPVATAGATVLARQLLDAPPGPTERRSGWEPARRPGQRQP